MATRSRSKGIRTGGIPCEPSPAIALDFTNPVHAVFEEGADGKPQMVLRGAERASEAELAKRLAKASLRPKTAQKPCDVGLFSDEANQLDLCEMFQDYEEDGL